MDDARTLRQRLDDINREIREYPGPIARCDEHLPALLEERRRIVETLARLQERSP